MNADPWTLYWQNDNLQSCIASQFPEDIEVIKLYWQGLLSGLESNANVLDLASGNGAVPSMLLSINKQLKITAVDLADIAPEKYLNQAAELKSVHFIPNTDICNLPFPENSFDAVTSQFGLEYAPLKQACFAAVKVLKPGGKLQLLVHHANSDIVSPSVLTRSEIDLLLSPGGVVEAACAFTSGHIDLARLEKVGQDYLGSDAVRTQSVSGQIFAGIDQVITLKESQAEQAAQLAHAMKLRLAAESARLKQLQEAALGENEIQQLSTWLSDSGLSVDITLPLTIQSENRPEALVGWQLKGTKK
ncbi:MAG: class I SAM-dependent methyltransferase [Pseudomonadales bacterium]